MSHTAIVTGGTRGIGAAIARRLADHGAEVAIAEIDAERAETARARIEAAGGRASAHPVGVREAAQVAALAAMVIHYSRTLSERTETDHQLRHLADKATRDPLSGLFNRAFLESHLDGLGPHARGGLLFIDLDHFKVVNETSLGKVFFK